MTPQAKLTFTGLDALTGAPAIPPATVDELLAALDAERQAHIEDNALNLQANRDLNLRDALAEGKLGLPSIFHKYEDELAVVRWGLVYPEGLDLAVLEALSPLVKHRCGAMIPVPQDCLDNPKIWKDLCIEVPKQHLDDADGFRTAHKETAGDANPAVLPYYLLIVGSPAAPGGISFNFQQRLSDVRPVGRVYFEKPDQYAAYARKVIEHEKGAGPVRQRRACFFPAVIDDATHSAATILAGGVKLFIENFSPLAAFKVSTVDENQTTRQELLNQLASPVPFLLTTGHGLSYTFDPVDPQNSFARQQRWMGALVCHDRQGKSGPISLQDCLSGDDIASNLDLGGLVVFSFACHSAGAPQIERFASYYKRLPQRLAGQDFISRLPQRLLEQGALAYIGHIDKTWGHSYIDPQIGADVDTFNWVISGILSGLRVGQAFKSLPDKYLDLNSRLYGNKNLFEKYEDGKAGSKEILATWMTRQDARAYVILGDPAVKLYPDRLQPA
jgi:hypothetical protein